MPTTFLDISMSLDGFVAGRDPRPDQPLGDGGEQLHEWGYDLEAWRRPHGREGGRRDDDSDLVERLNARTGAVVMGRRMFSGGAGPWEEDANRMGWWGDDPPFKTPVFVVTHHARETLPMSGGTTFHFVTEGVPTAIERAREAASGRDVKVAGGASVAQQALAAGMLDELHLHVPPVLLGGGVPLFAGAGRLELAGSQSSERVTHLHYRVAP